MKLYALGLCCSLVAATEAVAQSQLNGRVINTAGTPLRAANVTVRDSLRGTKYDALSDSLGRFYILLPEEALPGLFIVRAELIGYMVVDHATLQVGRHQEISLSLEMDQRVISLRPLNVIARQDAGFLTGYYARSDRVKHSGGGYILDRKKLAQSGDLPVARVLASVPGLRYIPARRNSPETVQSTRGNCTPGFFLDGMPLAITDLSMFSSSTLEGVEVYHASNAPVEFRDSRACGVVLMWSRRGERVTGSRFPAIGFALVGSAIAAVFLLAK
jgi:hypothetical protein